MAVAKSAPPPAGEAMAMRNPSPAPGSLREESVAGGAGGGEIGSPAGLRTRGGRGRAQLPGLEGAELAEQHRIRRAGVLRVVLEDRPLEILHGVGLAVQRAHLGELVGDGVALLGQPTVALPVGAEHPAERVARLREGAGVGGANMLVRRARGTIVLVI